MNVIKIHIVKILRKKKHKGNKSSIVHPQYNHCSVFYNFVGVFSMHITNSYDPLYMWDRWVFYIKFLSHIYTYHYYISFFPMSLEIVEKYSLHNCKLHNVGYSFHHLPNY